MFRVGFGYDVHRLEEGIPFCLGGIRVDHSKGAVGHSDADVLIHAICDALLGAASLRDIGVHFPDTDASLKGIDSKILLHKVAHLIEMQGWKVGNIDATVCLQQPKIKDLIPAMQEIIEHTAHLPAGTVSIKATTTEKLGFVGEEKGVTAYAVALIEKRM